MLIWWVYSGRSLHQEALENALRVLAGEENYKAVDIINSCLETARLRAKKAQEQLRRDLGGCDVMGAANQIGGLRL